MKKVGKFREDQREDPALFRLCFVVAAVHEDVLLPRVAVKIAIQHNATFLVQVFYEFLCVVNGRVDILIRIFPTAI